MPIPRAAQGTCPLTTPPRGALTGENVPRRNNPADLRLRMAGMKKPSTKTAKRPARTTALAAVAGVAAAAVVLSVAELIGAFFTARATPLIALGSTFIDFTPPWLKDFAIATFGTNDKLALFAGMGVTIFLLACVLGHRRLPEVVLGRGRRAVDGRRHRRQRGDPGQREARWTPSRPWSGPWRA